jgi:type II secretory pathway pseudopilin PulG
MELLVYMAIVGIVVVIAGEAFSNSTKFRIRTDNMIKATQEAENVATLFKEDLMQIGAKSSRENGDADLGSEYGVKFSEVFSNVYMDPDNIDLDKRDSSSFLIEDNKDFNGITFRRVRYDDNGFYQAVEEVRWHVSHDSLKRSCRIVDKALGVDIPNTDPCSSEAEDVVMATGVKIFKIEVANPGVKEKLAQVFPFSDNPNEFRLIPRTPDVGYAPIQVVNSNGDVLLGGTELTLSGFATNYQNSDGLDGGVIPDAHWVRNQVYAIKNESTAEDADWSTLCDEYGKLTLHPDTVYEISFEMGAPLEDDKSLTFVPGVDHMSVGFRKAGSGDFAKKEGKVILQDFLFFPPLDESKGAGLRTMRFSVPERVDNVCLTFTFACFSPLVSDGKVKIKNLKLKQVATATYKFDGFQPEQGLNKKEKKNVKALKMRLQVSRGSKKGGKGETGEVSQVIAIPSNGPRD